MVIPIERLERFAGFVRESVWIFAKTMPSHPHWYALRAKSHPVEFEHAVMFIREFGYNEPWGGRVYTYFDHDGYAYWTMGAPLTETILINRCEIKEGKKLG